MLLFSKTWLKGAVKDAHPFFKFWLKSLLNSKLINNWDIRVFIFMANSIHRKRKLLQYLAVLMLCLYITWLWTNPFYEHDGKYIQTTDVNLPHMFLDAQANS